MESAQINALIYDYFCQTKEKALAETVKIKFKTVSQENI